MKNRILKLCFTPLLALSFLSGCNKSNENENIDVPPHNHMFSEIAHPNYMVEPATFTHGSTYKKSCECGETNDETFTLENTL